MNYDISRAFGTRFTKRGFIIAGGGGVETCAAQDQVVGHGDRLHPAEERTWMNVSLICRVVFGARTVSEEYCFFERNSEAAQTVQQLNLETAAGNCGRCAPPPRARDEYQIVRIDCAFRRVCGIASQSSAIVWW